MLILSRKTGQGLVLQVGGERIVVSVHEVRGSQVRLAVDGDRQRCKVLRTELEGRDGQNEADQAPAVGAV
jgi:carbon storage regulator CsrA